MSDEDLRLVAARGAKTVQGNVDGAENGRIRGWAFDPHQATKRIRIGIYLGEQCLFTFEADRMRQDLLELGFGDGRHGFDVAIPVELFATPLLTFQVCHMDSGSELTGSPIVMRAPRIQINYFHDRNAIPYGTPVPKPGNLVGRSTGDFSLFAEACWRVGYEGWKTLVVERCE